VIRAVRRRVRLPELDAAAVPRAAQLGVALSALALTVAVVTLVLLVVGLGHKADRAEVRAAGAADQAASSDARSAALQLSVCRLAYAQRPNAPGIAAPSTKRAADLAPYWQDVFAATSCSHIPTVVLARPPAATPSPAPTSGGPR
jgi:hypothetical protein